MSISGFTPMVSSLMRSGAFRQAAQQAGRNAGMFVQEFGNTALTHHVVGPHVQNAATTGLKGAGDYIAKAKQSLSSYSFENGAIRR